MNHRALFWIIAVIILIFGMTSVEFLRTKPNNGYELQVEEIGTGWMYRIYEKGKLVIQQQTIPGVSERKPFATRKDAEKVGSLVIRRLEKNRSPRISKADLEQNEIAY